MEFFDQKNGNHRDETATINLESQVIIYLAYFDEARGHQLLLVYPSELKNDTEFLQAESKTVFIHSIWWMSVDVQAELSHVDLEFGGRNYLAKKFLAPSHRPKKRSGMDENTPETVVLMLSIPINLNPLGGELLNKLYQELTTKHLDEFSKAIEKSICDAKIIKSPKDKEISIAGDKIIEKMTATIHFVLHEYAKHLEVNVSSEEDKRKALAYLLYQDIKKKSPVKVSKDVFFETASSAPIVDIGAVIRSKIRLADASVNKNDNQINVTLINAASGDICNCVVSIAYIEDFFEKYFYDVNVDCWFQGEELNFQFERIAAKPKEEYLVSVKEEGNVIFQNRILTNKLKVI
nr:hypothetical protein [Candidatus Sigynarchaeota archaeon]